MSQSHEQAPSPSLAIDRGMDHRTSVIIMQLIENLIDDHRRLAEDNKELQHSLRMEHATTPNR